jgi:hypothetical protein
MDSRSVPFPAPLGFRWIFVRSFIHWRSKKTIEAEAHGKKAFCFLIREKR